MEENNWKLQVARKIAQSAEKITGLGPVNIPGSYNALWKDFRISLTSLIGSFLLAYHMNTGYSSGRYCT